MGDKHVVKMGGAGLKSLTGDQFAIISSPFDHQSTLMTDQFWTQQQLFEI